MTTQGAERMYLVGETVKTLVEPLNLQKRKSGENIIPIYLEDLGDLAVTAAREETPTTTSTIIVEIMAKEEMGGNIGVITTKTIRKTMVWVLVMRVAVVMVARGGMQEMYN